MKATHTISFNKDYTGTVTSDTVIVAQAEGRIDIQGKAGDIVTVVGEIDDCRNCPPIVISVELE